MKRQIISGLMLGLGLGAAACSPGAAPKVEPEARQDAWIQPPAIQAVARGTGSLVFSGAAEPGVRVVLRAEDGQAYAAAADAQGRFDIRMVPPAGHLMLRPEAQQGEDAAPSPEVLLIVDGGRGPIALLRGGAPARRLDDGPALGAIDSDGRLAVASGRTEGQAPSVAMGGAAEARAVGQGQGRWTSILGTPPSGGATVRVGGETYAWPGDMGRSEGARVERAGEGWSIGWPGPAGGWQTTWLPDAAR